MQPCPDENLLARVVQAQAGDAERATIDRHVDVCPACAELVAHLARTYFDDVRRAPESAATGAMAGGPRTSLAPGTSLGRYELGPKIGAGGMGTVYAARDPVLRRPVALKVIPRRVGEADDEGRLLREARAMARVSHPNVVPVFDAGVDGDLVFVAMELVRGPSLRRYLSMSTSIAPEEIVALFADAARGLAAAHAAAVVHRDFKPENVLVTLEGGPRAQVTDFGLARPPRRLDDGTAPSSEGRAAWIAEHLSHETSGGGTPAFMSPEQLDGAEIGEASDQFSFAVALYEALYKKHPFPAGTLAKMRRKMDEGPVVPPDTSDVPGWLWPIVARGLRVRREERWPSMTAFLGALEMGEASGAEWHLVLHAFVLGLMFFVSAGLVAATVAGLLSSDDGSGGDSSWAVTAAAGGLAVLVFSGWAPIGMAVTLLNAYGLVRRRRWAFMTTVVYAATALVSCVGAPYAAFALYSLTRPSVRAALGRPPKRRKR